MGSKYLPKFNSQKVFSPEQAADLVKEKVNIDNVAWVNPSQTRMITINRDTWEITLF